MSKFLLIFFSLFVFAQNAKTNELENVVTTISEQNSSLQLFLQKKNLSKLNSLLLDSNAYISTDLNSKTSLVDLAKNYAVLLNVKKYASLILKSRIDVEELEKIFSSNHERQILSAINSLNKPVPEKQVYQAKDNSSNDFKNYAFAILLVGISLASWGVYRGYSCKKRERKLNKLISQEYKSRLLVKVYENAKSDNFFVVANNKIVYKSTKTDQSIESLSGILNSYISLKEFEVVTKLGQNKEISYFKKASIGSIDIYEIHKHVPEMVISKPIEYSPIRGLIPSDITM